MNVKILFVGVALAATCVNAHATTTTISWDITASGFSGGVGTPPVDPVLEQFTITFDPTAAAYTGPTSVGLNVTSFNLPYSSQFSYDSTPGGILTVATEAFVDGFGVDPNTYGIFLSTPFDSTSNASFMYMDSAGNLWEASSVIATAVATTPLPSTWWMLFGGLAGLGLLSYCSTRKNRAVLAAA